MSPPKWRALRLLGSIAVLAVLVAVVSPTALHAAFTRVSPSVLAIAMVILLVSHLAAALKWRMLMGPDAGMSVKTAFRAHFTGLVSSLSPLGVIGGDIVRAGVAINGSTRPGSVMVTSVLDRIVDTAALLVLILVGVLLVGRGSSAAAIVLWGGLALFAIGIVLSFIALALLRRDRTPRLASVREAARVAADRPGLIARALLLSIATQAALISANVYIGSSVGVHSSFGAWLVAWPASKLIGYVPIGVAGIGIRESALVALLKPFGGAPGSVMAAGLLWQAVLIVGSVSGWLALSVIPNTPDGFGRSQASRNLLP